MNLINLLYISFSKSLEKQVMTDIGRYSLNLFVSLSLKIGVTKAIFSESGMVLLRNVKLKIYQRFRHFFCNSFDNLHTCTITPWTFL